MNEPMIVEVNGQKFEKKPERPRKTSPTMNRLTTTAMMVGGVGMLPGPASFPQRGGNDELSKYLNDDMLLVNEYRLIKQKKSNLSRSKRDAIVRIFENKFVPIIK